MKIELTEYENYHDREKIAMFLSCMSEQKSLVAKIALDTFLEAYGDTINREEAHVCSSFRTQDFCLSFSGDIVYFSFYKEKDGLLVPSLSLSFSRSSQNTPIYNAKDYFHRIGIDCSMMTQNMKKLIDLNMEILSQYYLINKQSSYLFRTSEINLRKFFSLGDLTATYDYQVARLHYTERGLLILKRQRNRARFSKISARIGVTQDSNKIAASLNLLLCGIGNNKFNISFLANRTLEDAELATIREKIDCSIRQEILRQLKALKMTDASINSNFLKYSVDEVNHYLSLAEIMSV